MNRDDPRHHQGQYRGHHQNRRYNRGEREGSFKSHYESGSWLENQKRSAAGWHKTTHIRDWNKPRRPLGQSQELPPGALPKPVPPPPTKPLPTTEELFQEKIKQTSGSLLKQMEECPDAELVLPSRNSMDCQMKEDTNENILPAISYLQAEADATAAELSASKKKAKKAALHAQQERVREIVQIVRQLKRQERLKVSRDIRDMHNKTRNIDECDNINALVPDISVQLNVLPDECIAIISSILNSDLEPLPEPTDAPVIIQDSSFNVDNSNSGGNEFYDPFEYDICDNSSQESSRFDAVQEPPHHALHTYPESNTRENNFDDDSRSPTSVDIKPEPEYIRTYKYHIKPGRAESRGPNKFKLKRDLSNDNGHSFNNTRTTPQPVPHPTHSTRPYNQRSQRSPTRESKHFRSQVKRHEKTPPPLIIGPQIASVPQRSPSPTFDNPHNESRKIRVIKEAHEVFNRTVHTSKPVEGDTNERHAVPNNDKTVNEVSKTDVNGISEENDILFREKFDLGSSDEDDWNRNLILKSKERVLREIAEEEAKVLRLALKNAEAKTQSNVHNGFIESNTRDSVRSMEEERVQMETEPVKTPTLPLQTHVQCTEEELDYDPRFSDSEEERIQVECTEQIVDDSTREVVESITEKSDTNLPESPKDKAVTKPDGTPVIVLEATSKPGTYKAKQGKLVNEHMYCKNVTSTEDASENQLDKSKPNEVSEGIQTEDLPVTTVADGGEKSTAVVSKPDTSHSHKEKHKRSRSKSSSSTKHAKTSSTSRSKSKSDKTSLPKSKSHTDSASSASTFSTSKKNTIEQAITSAHEEKDKTILGRLRARYQRYKKHSRAVISKLENIDREMRKLLDERRNIYKEFHAFVSTSESEEDMPHGEEHAKRRLSETGTSQNSPSQHSSDNPSKKKPVKYIIISEGDSTPSKHLNPVLNSDTPNELVLTQVLHDNPEDIPNPDSPPNFLMPSMDVDIFSMFSEPQNKPPFNEPVVAQEAEEEQLGEDSDSVPEAGTTEMQIDLGGVMNISQTMPTDFLEPSDNECMGESPVKNPHVKLIKYDIEGLQRMREIYRTNLQTRFYPFAITT
ncbi:uncharacterized protein [Atheta coriaria]|uniref:uncharacterized protein isoform X2 n=1 Tax=Dalotia coriaria TaxID=877792 RepID=UPI0031F36561